MTRMFRRIAIGLAALLALAVVGGFVAFDLVGPRLVGEQVRAALAKAGFPEAKLGAVEIGLWRATIADVALDAAGRQRVALVEATYSLLRLLEGRIDQVDIRGVDVTAQLDAGGGIAIEGREPAASGGAASTPPAVPVDRLILHDGRLTLATPVGPVVARLALTASSPSRDVVEIDGEARLEHDRGGAAIAIDGAWIVGRAVSAKLAIGEGFLRAEQVTAEGVEGVAVVEWPQAGAPLVDIRVNLPGVALGDARLAPIAFDYKLEAERHRIALRADAPNQSAAGRIEAVLAPAGDAAGATLSGPWSLRISGLELPGLLAGLAADAAGEAMVGKEGLSITSAQGWRVSGAPAMTAAPFVPPAGGWERLVLELLPLDAATPLRLDVKPGDGEVAVAFQGGFALRDGGSEAVSGAIGRLSVALADAAPPRFELADLRLAAKPLRLGAATIGLTVERAALRGTADAAQGDLDVLISLAGAFPGGAALRQGSIRLATALTLDADRLAFAPRDCVAIEAQRLQLGPLAVQQPTKLCLEPVKDAPLLSLALASTAPELATIALRLPPTRWRGTLARDGGAQPVEGSLPDAIIRAAFAGDGSLSRAAVAGKDGRIALPAFDLVVDGIAADLALDAAAAPPLTLRLSADAVRHTAEPAAIVPLKLTAQARGRPGGALELSGQLGDASGALVVTLRGTHDLAAQSGRAAIKLAPLTFLPQVRPPPALFPLLAGQVDAATGTIALDSELAWRAGATTGRAELLLKDLSVETAAGTIGGVNGVLRADSLMPPVLPAGQTIAIGLLDIGVPLTDGVIEFGLGGDGVLAVSKAEWRWAGGVVRAAPFAAALEQAERSLELQAEGIELGEVLALAGVQGLAATGTLRGKLPVRMSAERIAVESAVLEAAGPGRISYDPASPPAGLGQAGGNAAVAMQVLRNLHYDSLAVTIDGTVGGESKVTLRLNGRNPDFQGGYPVALNVNLSGALDTILRRGLGAYRIPDSVREQIERYQKRNP